ncbi:hypothetical protein EG343_07330 [Chryseobacterium nakagawai]|uniref:Natural product n=2 Tax=Chryseobacterium nakagawai TaxID=1241982 RepID=A0AAD0YMF6_CHRNA|nr:hypothetical protein EG343_07330 [Chryseobacterium nakagawai]
MSVMKNLKKLQRAELKIVKGGDIPIGCDTWDAGKRCCREWQTEYCNSPTCPDAPPPFCG